MIAARGLRYSLPDRREILAGIDFDLAPGRFLAVLGENGAGKTTLIDLLMGFRRRSAGTISVLGRDPESDPWESRARIAYLSEKHESSSRRSAGRQRAMPVERSASGQHASRLQDHPIVLTIPETRYLKGLLLEALD
jgi:ABC-type Mn2+/Zn2+ transport system ATPase subunit